MCRASSELLFDDPAIFGFKGCQACVEEFSLGDDHDVVPRSDFVSTEDLPNQSFRSIPLDRAPELFRGRDTEAAKASIAGQDEDCEVAAVCPGTALVNELEFSATAQPFVGPETSHGRAVGPGYSLLTVRRLRPLARRRLRTRRPFFVLIRTRNPWARAR